MERAQNQVQNLENTNVIVQESLHELENIDVIDQPQAKGVEPAQDHNPEDNQNQGLTIVPVTSRKKRYIITFSIIGVLSALALTLGLVYKFHYEPKATEGAQSVINLSPGNNIVTKQIKYVDRNFGKDDVIFNVYAFYGCSLCTKSRLLQEETTPTDYYINHGNGIITKIGANGQLAIFIDNDKFVETILQEEEPSRMLQTDLPADALYTDQAIQDEYLSLLNSIFSQLADEQLKFSDQPFVTYTLNVETNQMQVEAPPNQTSRRLLFRFRGAIKNVVDRTVKPAVQAVRNNGPAIGAAVGTVAGGAIGAAAGGPMGAIAGAQAGRQIGGQIGTVAQGAIKACIPENTVRFRCNAKQLVNQAKTAGINMAEQAAYNAINQHTAGYPAPPIGKNTFGRIRRGGRRK